MLHIADAFWYFKYLLLHWFLICLFEIITNIFIIATSIIQSLIELQIPLFSAKTETY